MRQLLLSLCGVLAGCGRIGFSAVPGDDARDGNLADDTGDTGDAIAAGLTCASGQTPAVFEDFIGTGAPCGAGTLNMNGGMAIARASGVLQLAPQSGSSGSAYCTWDPFALGGGAILHVPVAMTASTFDDTTLTLYALAGAAAAQFQVFITTGPFLGLDDNVNSPVATTDWNATVSWLRLTPTDATHVAGAYSADGTTWTDFGTIAWTGASTTTAVKLAVGSSYTQATTTTDITQIDAIYSCP